MPVLKDVRCSRCERTAEAVMDGDQRAIVLRCRHCGIDSMHESLCNGGIKSRYRWNDFDGLDAGGYVEHLGVRAGTPQADHIGTDLESRTAAPMQCAKTGRVYHDADKYSRDGIAERRSKRKSERRRREGRAPIVMDLGK